MPPPVSRKKNLPIKSAAGGASLTLRISEVARRVGISSSALRAWEQLGLVAPQRSKSRYRLYNEADVRLLQRALFLRAPSLCPPKLPRFRASGFGGCGRVGDSPLRKWRAPQVCRSASSVRWNADKCVPRWLRCAGLRGFTARTYFRYSKPLGRIPGWYDLRKEKFWRRTREFVWNCSLGATQRWSHICSA